MNLSGPRRAIRPEIYGVNFGDDAQHVDLRYPLRRSGGNSTTRYNWQSDSHNTAFDWFWQNIADGSGSGCRLLRAHDRTQEGTVLPVERLGHERHVGGATAAEEDRRDRHAGRVLPLGGG